MEASYDSASGVYACSWELQDREHVTLSVEVPFGGSALLHLPLAPQEVYEVCHLEPGRYTVSYRLSEPLRKTYDLDTPLWQLKAEPDVVKALEGLLDLKAVGEEYMGRSVRGYQDMFKWIISKETMEQIGAVLARCE